MQVLAEVAVEPGDRLDLIASRVLGDPEHFWRWLRTRRKRSTKKRYRRPG